MKPFVLTLSAAALLPASAHASVMADGTPIGAASVHTGFVGSGADFYASGPDDGFEEYGLQTFSFSAADFGGPITDITEVLLTLTVNDRTFSDGTEVEIFFSSDDFGGDYSALVYDAAASPTSGIDPADFTSLVSLGVYGLPGGNPTTTGGELDVFTLDFSSIEADLIAEINSGSEFSILIGATGVNDDITYSGLGNTFDPGDPLLSITAVPEPGSLALLGLGGLLVARRRRG